MSEQNAPLLPESDRALAQQFLDLYNGIDKENPDPAHIQAMRDMLCDHHDLWRTCGDLAQLAAATLTKRLEAFPHIAESLKCGWRAMKEELGYSMAPPLEKLLIEQVVLCSMHNYLVAAEYNLVMTRSIPESSIDHWERRLSSAQRRYLGAIESLARIRKYARTSPALQVNIAADGGQQLNLLGGAPPDDDEH